MGKRAENGFKRESFVRMQTAVNLENYRKLLDGASQGEVSSGMPRAVGNRDAKPVIIQKFGCFAELVEQQQMLMYGTAF